MTDAPRRAAHAPVPPTPPRRSLRGAALSRRRRFAFSLIELVIVVMIIAIIAAIATRRLARHAEQSATNAAQQDTSVLQQAIERYRAEHGTYPTLPGTTLADQLTKYTDSSGNVSATRTPPYVYGPYVRKIPPVPIGPVRGSTVVSGAPGAGIGWVYDPATGEIRPNDNIPINPN
jgi:prepilin-type N-terminal cleavage/methylation domain-containing protein